MIERRTTKSRDDYRTPIEEIDLVKRIFGGQIDLDPCADVEREHHFATVNYPPKGDGLRWPWFGNVFINPPYGNELLPWVNEGRYQHAYEFTTAQVWLIPARPGSKWWNTLMRFCPVFAVKNKRITFEGATIGAGFPSALAYCGPDEVRFIEMVVDAGWKPYRQVED